MKATSDRIRTYSGCTIRYMVLASFGQSKALWFDGALYPMSQETGLNELLDAVVDEESFLAFARALHTDKQDEDEKEEINPSNPYSHGWNGWKTAGIADFLESAIAWAEDSEFGDRLEQPPANPWKKFAPFLYGGKIYE